MATPDYRRYVQQFQKKWAKLFPGFDLPGDKEIKMLIFGHVKKSKIPRSSICPGIVPEVCAVTRFLLYALDVAKQEFDGLKKPPKINNMFGLIYMGLWGQDNEWLRHATKHYICQRR